MLHVRGLRAELRAKALQGTGGKWRLISSNVFELQRHPLKFHLNLPLLTVHQWPCV